MNAATWKRFLTSFMRIAKLKYNKVTQIHPLAWGLEILFNDHHQVEQGGLPALLDFVPTDVHIHASEGG